MSELGPARDIAVSCTTSSSVCLRRTRFEKVRGMGGRHREDSRRSDGPLRTLSPRDTSSSPRRAAAATFASTSATARRSGRCTGRLGVDAVACAAGGVPYRPLAELTADDLQSGVADKLLGQVELVRQGLTHVAEDGSFALVTGILARQPIPTGTMASLVNGALESFVKAAAMELPGKQRINAVSPTVFEEALDVYGSFFPGFLPVPLADVAATYVRSIVGAQNGRSCAGQVSRRQQSGASVRGRSAVWRRQ